MAELDYFCTRAEFTSLLKEALAAGYKVQMKKHLSAPKLQYCATVDDVECAVAGGQHAFLLERDDLTRYVLKPQSAERDGVPFWYVRPKEGGPLIEMYFFSPYEREGRKVVPCSLISYHQRVINPSTGEPEPAGQAVKVAFGDLVRGLRTQSRRVRWTSRMALVSPDVESMLAEGWTLDAPFADATLSEIARRD